MADRNPGDEPPLLERIDIAQNRAKPDDFLIVLQTSTDRTEFHIPRRMLAEIGRQFLAADDHFSQGRQH